MHAPLALKLVQVLVLLSYPAGGGLVGQEYQEGRFPEHHLSIDPPELENLRDDVAGEEAADRSWIGNRGDAQVRILVTILAQPFSEPEDLSELAIEAMGSQDEDFRVSSSELVKGPNGFAGMAVVFDADIVGHEGTVDGRQYVQCGLLPEAGYVVHLQYWPVPSAEDVAFVHDFLAKGIRYDGPVRDPAWTIEEIEARWLRDAPEELHADFQKNIKKKRWLKKSVTRTEHYLILTNSGGGEHFGKVLEENYETIQKIFPFEEAPERRLMPIFLFLTPDQYYDYYARVANRPLEEARKSKGHAWRDYYATWYEAPGDSVHIHEQVHQIFGNRLRFGGGGSWLQEGVAEYVETRPNERGQVARLVEKGRHTPLREFFGLASLLHSTEEDVKGGSRAGDNYKQAALFIEFLRESEFGKARFEDFLPAVGNLPRGRVELIEAAFQEVYGVSIEELELEFQAYCKKR